MPQFIINLMQILMITFLFQGGMKVSLRCVKLIVINIIPTLIQIVLETHSQVLKTRKISDLPLFYLHYEI